MNFKNPYDREEYLKFFRNSFFPQDFQQKEEKIDFYSFKPQFIKEVTLIGVVTSLDNIRIYEILHKSENDSRVGITREICRMMQSSGINKSLCLLISKSKNFRFSLVTVDFELDDRKIIKKYSNPKRYSFYLGEEAKTITPEQFLIKKGTVKDFEDLKNRFSIEVVNKEFYNKIALLFTKLVGGKRKIGSVEQDEKGILILPEKLDHHKMQEFAVRLIGRIMFCWFLKKKYSESGIPLIDDKILSKDIIGEYNNYYHECLERLFFEVLNTPQNKRKNEINSSVFKNVPFLNGGLFEPHREDFNSDERLKISNRWFGEFFEILETYNFTIDENTSVDVELSIEPEMLGRIFENLLAEINPETGDTARKSSGSYYTPRQIVEYMVSESLRQYLINKTGIDEIKIAELLKEYDDSETINLSLDEAKSFKDSLEQLKIIDPACGSGAFPMGILHKVLNAHLKIDEIIAHEAQKESREKSDENIYLSMGQKIIYRPDDNLNVECEYIGKYEFNLKIEERLEKTFKIHGNLKVNDLTLSVKHYINYYNSIHKKKTIANIFSQGSIEGGKSFNTLRSKNNYKRIVSKNEGFILWEYKDYKVENKTRTNREEEDENYMSNEYSYSKYLYNLKKQIIHDSIYGVDIQPIAVDISRLRTFLSLIVDEKVNDKAENMGIESLPNLEFNFVCANSLIGLPSRDEKDLWEDNFVEILKDIRERFFSSAGKSKNELINEYKMKREAILRSLNFYNSNDFKAKMLADWDPFSDEPAKWFDPEWMFGISTSSMTESGFDIVIANPPYLQLQRLKGNPIQEEYKKQKFKVYDANGDIYCLFYEKGIELLSDKGIITYITSNKWMRAGYGEKLREYFLLYNPLILVDLGPGVFESATVDTNILIIQKNKSVNDSSKNLNALSLNKIVDNNYNLSEVIKTKGTKLINLTNEIWVIGSDKEQKLKGKIGKISKPLIEWDVNIYYGIKTGLNEAFIIDNETKDILCKEDPKSKEILKPILRGRDIKRYGYEWAGLWLIQSGYNINIPQKYTSIYKHLIQYEKKAKQRDDQGENWWNLRACAYYDEFQKEKIVWPRLTRLHKGINEDFPRFAYVDKDTYIIDSMCFITGKFNKYVIACLNSFFGKYYFMDNVAKLDNGGLQMRQQYIDLFPIPTITSVYHQIVNKIENFVDKILNEKKQNPKADTTVLERQIDELVYKLYGLTEEEIKIVEGRSE